MSKKRCLRCEESEMALLGNATIPVTSETYPSGSSASKTGYETSEFLFQVYVCPSCRYVELSK